MRILPVCLGLSALLLLSNAARAENKFDPAARVKVIAPFLELQTTVVIHVDVTRIKVDPLFDQLVRLVPQVKDQLAELKLALSVPQALLTGAGGKDIYVIFTLSRPLVSEPVFAVIPLEPGMGETALRALCEKGDIAVERRGGLLLLMSRRQGTSEWLNSLKPAPRPEVTAAFEAAGDTAVQVLLVPPAYTARVIDEVMPQLPQEIGNGPSRIMSRGISWAALGLDAPPHPALRLVVQSKDASAATALLAKWVEIQGILRRNQEIKEYLPEYDRLARLLMPAVEKDRLTLVLDEKNQRAGELLSALAPNLEKSLRVARWRESQNNLKQLILAMHNYNDRVGHFITPAIYSKDGKPLLSWRVALLPYVEQGPLFQQFHLDEPWDSPHNKTLIAKMPALFHPPVSRLKIQEGRTNYVLPVGPGTAFAGPKPMKFPNDIPDGTSCTIGILEVNDNQAVIWTKPDDLPFNPKQPKKGLGGLYPKGFNIAMFDGSTRFVPLTISNETLRNAINPADGQVLGSDWR